MIFHIAFEYSPEQRDEAHRRFKETGAPPPSGVTMTGRWHSAEGNRGFLVAESSEAEAIARWLQEWTDAMSFEVTPVLTDEQFIEVIT
jgi:hypothetical protein